MPRYMQAVAGFYAFVAMNSYSECPAASCLLSDCSGTMILFFCISGSILVKQNFLLHLPVLLKVRMKPIKHLKTCLSASVLPVFFANHANIAKVESRSKACFDYAETKRIYERQFKYTDFPDNDCPALNGLDALIRLQLSVHRR